MKQLLLIAIATIASASITLQSQKRSIVARGLSSWGGYALLTSPCPSGSSTCGTASCCPTGYTCNTSGSADTPICCPSSNDCSATVKALNACADNSWELYSFAGLFCCPSDTVGTFSSAGKQCIARSLPIPTSISLSMVSQVTGTAAAAAATRGASGTTGANGSQTTSTSGSGTGFGTSSSTGSGSGSGTGTGTSSSHSSLPQGAIIAIAVLGLIVGLLAVFIIWRFSKRKSRPQQQYSAVSPINPQTSNLDHEKYSTPSNYPSPHPQTQELAGKGAPRRDNEIYSVPETYTSPQLATYTSPQPTTYMDAQPTTYMSAHPQTQELSGQSTSHTGLVYETEGAHRIELDGRH